jgi:hypothetical protein
MLISPCRVTWLEIFHSTQWQSEQLRPNRLYTVLTGDFSNMRTVTGLEVFTAMTNTNFWVVTYCSSVETSGSGCRLLFAIFCLAYSSTPKMEAIHSFEMLVDFYRTTLRYNPEDRILHGNGCWKFSRQLSTPACFFCFKIIILLLKLHFHKLRWEIMNDNPHCFVLANCIWWTFKYAAETNDCMSPRKYGTSGATVPQWMMHVLQKFYPRP